MLLVRSLTSSNFVSQICQISSSAAVGNSIFTRWQVGKLESFEFRLDRFFGLPNTALALAGRGDVLQLAAGAAPLMALDLRQRGLRSVVRPRRWDGPKATKTTATRIAECDLAASEAGDGNAKGSGKIQVISPKVAGGSDGFLRFFFRRIVGFWNMLENAVILLTANWRCVVRGQSVGDV